VQRRRPAGHAGISLPCLTRARPLGRSAATLRERAREKKDGRAPSKVESHAATDWPRIIKLYVVMRYPYALAADADLHASLGNLPEARAYLERALGQQSSPPERALLARKRAALE
jgi:hypothetical protein